MLERKQLLKESEWVRVYSLGEKQLRYESRFLTDGLEVSAQSLSERWPRLTSEERMEFAFAFAAKPHFSQNDREILSLLMRAGDEAIWSTIALTLVYHFDRQTVFDFLVNLVRNPRPGCANYFQALELLGDKRAVPVLRHFYGAYREQQREQRPSQLLSEHQWETDFLRLCRALLVLEGDREFELAIREMLKHPEEEVRARAQRFLQ